MSVKRSRTINFQTCNSGQDVNVLRVRIAHRHSVVKCVRSNGQGPICSAVKWSSNKNDGQNFLTPVAAVTTAPIGVTTPCLRGTRERLCLSSVIHELTNHAHTQTHTLVGVGLFKVCVVCPLVTARGVPGEGLESLPW